MLFNTFETVQMWYETTKPVVSKNYKKEQDIRPIGERRYTYKRIKKYDDNCYALLDGDYSADRTSDDYERAMAPIVWTRDPESGDTFIRVRNGVAPYAHTSRYRFLQWYLPQTIRFENDQSGTQYVRVCTDNVLRNTGRANSWETFDLPKTSHAWSHANKRPSGGDDNLFLLFKCNEDGTFTRWGDKIVVRMHTINADLKREWKPRIESFYMFTAAVTPLLDFSWNAQGQYLNQIDEWKQSSGCTHPFGTLWGRPSLFGIPKDIARDIVINTEHPLRVAVAALIARTIDGHKEIKSKEQLREVRKSYNRVMNKFLHMQETKEV
jgi:hypothetical protein